MSLSIAAITGHCDRCYPSSQ